MSRVHHCITCQLLLICLLGAGPATAQVAQDERFSVMDHVDLPAELGGKTDADLYLELSEEWIFFPDLPALRKKTGNYLVREPEGGSRSGEELSRLLTQRIRELPVSRGKYVLRQVEYEFNLLDPHVKGAGPDGFPEPDSMDRFTRELQASLIALVRGRIRNLHRYNLEEQLLSVRFHETWQFDPDSLEVLRRVDAITPVIWQRRRTAEGEPVNDAGTGWPVYYKNILSTIYLRNP